LLRSLIKGKEKTHDAIKGDGDNRQKLCRPVIGARKQPTNFIGLDPKTKNVASGDGRKRRGDVGKEKRPSKGNERTGP